MKLSPLLFILVINSACCQIDKTFEAILKESFQHPSFSTLIFDKSLDGTPTIYIYATKAFARHATNNYADTIVLPGLESSMAHLFDMNNRRVYAFGRVIRFGAHTRDEVDTVVVVDDLTYNNGNASLRMHTTTLSSKWHYKTNPRQTFVAIRVNLRRESSHWIVESVATRMFPFKSILDKEK